MWTLKARARILELQEEIKVLKKKKVVLIEVLGGVACVIDKPLGVELIIMDRDNMDEPVYGCSTEKYLTSECMKNGKEIT